MGAMMKVELAGPSEWLPAMTIEQAVDRYKLMVQFVSKVLVDGTDYGKIPGTGDKAKATLLKPGAEKLCTFFGLRKVPVVLEKEEDWTGERHGGEAFFHYAYRYELYRGDMLIAAADGSCNSWEKKYRWRMAERVCPECGKAAIIKGKEEYGGGWLCWKKKDGCGRNFAADDPAILEQQVGRVPNADPADLANNIRKMAQKRALVSAATLATNASDFFTVDLEDQVPDDHGDVIEGAPVRQASPRQQPPKSAPTKPTPENGLPPNGASLRNVLGRRDGSFSEQGLIGKGDLLSAVIKAGVDRGWSDDIATWNSAEQIQHAADVAKRFIDGRRAAPKPAGDGITFWNELDKIDEQLWNEGVLKQSEIPEEDERGRFRDRIVDVMAERTKCGRDPTTWTPESIRVGKEAAREYLADLQPA